ncbi:MAG TPA: hypothetical protein IAC70_02765 [Candidatus Faecicola pullistercoris]|nr:hypothetical protein [Candidatus Faecicola pullistercoris]
MKGRVPTSTLRVRIPAFEGISVDTEEELLPLGYSSFAYNFTFEDKSLKSGFGITDGTCRYLLGESTYHELPRFEDESIAIEYIHLYKRFDFERGKRDDRLIVKASDGYFYETKVFERDVFHKIQNLGASGRECSCCYRYNNKDVFLLSSEIAGLFMYDGSTVVHIGDAPNITSMCVHNERIFATIAGEGNSLWFSDDFDPMNWKISSQEGGFINFDDEGGRLNYVISFLDYLYIFRDYGIERLTAYQQQSEFTVNKLYIGSGRILTDTIASAGDSIIFMAEDGIYSFNGYSVNLLIKGITSRLVGVKSHANAAFINGVYYLACCLNYFDSNQILCEQLNFMKNNTLLIYNTVNRKFQLIRGVDIRRMLAVNILHQSSVLSIFHNQYSNRIGEFNKSGRVFGTVLPKHWSVAPRDFGYPDRKKALRNFYINTAYDVTVGITTDDHTEQYHIKGSDSPVKIVVNRACSKAGFYISCTGPVADITNPVLEFALTRG